MSDNRLRGRKWMEIREQVFRLHGDICWLCGGDGADTVDHILPLASGGGNELDNLMPAHGRKNRNCPGNFSKIRPTRKAQVQAQPITQDGITYGDGWVSKTRGTMTSKMYLDVTGLTIDDPFVQAFING